MSVSALMYSRVLRDLSEDDRYAAMVFHQEGNPDHKRTWLDLDEAEKAHWRLRAQSNAPREGDSGLATA